MTETQTHATAYVVTSEPEEGYGSVGAMEWRTNYLDTLAIYREWLQTADQDRNTLALYEITFPTHELDADRAAVTDGINQATLGGFDAPEGWKVQRYSVRPPQNAHLPALPIVVLDETEYANAVVVCPHCGQEDNIVEVDQAVRWNEGSFEIKDGQIDFVAWSLGQSDFEHDRYACGTCRGVIEMPENLHEDWS